MPEPLRRYWIDSGGVIHGDHDPRRATDAERWFQAERDRYGEALERIASVRAPLIETDPATLGYGYEKIARDALNG